MSKNCGCFIITEANPVIDLRDIGSTWGKLENKVPRGPNGSEILQLDPPPYGFTPLSTPRVPYEPKPVSAARSTWEGWRYGSNYVNTEEPQKAYGYPDFQYYNAKFCGAPCPNVSGTIPGLKGDPYGKNPNIQYIQLDYKNLLGSGFAVQGQGIQKQPQPPSSQTSPFTTNDSTSEPTEKQPVKFQIFIGDERKTKLERTPQSQSQSSTISQSQETSQSPMKIYLPLNVIPGHGRKHHPQQPQQVEVYLPGMEAGNNQNQEKEGKAAAANTNAATESGAGTTPGSEGPEDGVKPVRRKKRGPNPCGNCNACKNPCFKNPLRVKHVDKLRSANP